MAQSACAAKYTDCISAEGWDSPKQCPAYYIKQSDNEASGMLEFWGMQRTLFLPLFPGSLWSGVLASDKVLSMS